MAQCASRNLFRYGGFRSGLFLSFFHLSKAYKETGCEAKEYASIEFVNNVLEIVEKQKQVIPTTNNQATNEISCFYRKTENLKD